MRSVGTKQEQRTEEETVTAQKSFVFTRNVTRAALSSIAYMRNLFPDECFRDIDIGGTAMKALQPTTFEAKVLLRWFEKGVCDAINKKYLRTLIFGIHQIDEGSNSTDCDISSSKMIECYYFSFSYGDDNSVSMSLSGKMQSDYKMIKKQLRSNTQIMLRSIISLAQAMDPLPEDRFLTMKLLYFDDVTPVNYEPPDFRAASMKEIMKWDSKTVSVKLGGMKTPFHQMNLRVRAPVSTFGQENDDEMREMGYVIEKNKTDMDVPGGLEDQNPGVSQNSHHPSVRESTQTVTDRTMDLVEEELRGDALLQEIRVLVGRQEGTFTLRRILMCLPAYVTRDQIADCLRTLGREGVVDINRQGRYKFVGQQEMTTERPVAPSNVNEGELCTPPCADNSKCTDEVEINENKDTMEKIDADETLSVAKDMEKDEAKSYRQAIVKLLEKENEAMSHISAPVLSRLLDVSIVESRRILEHMQDDGLIARSISGRHGRKIIRDDHSVVVYEESINYMNDENMNDQQDDVESNASNATTEIGSLINLAATNNSASKRVYVPAEEKMEEDKESTRNGVDVESQKSIEQTMKKMKANLTISKDSTSSAQRSQILEFVDDIPEDETNCSKLDSSQGVYTPALHKKLRSLGENIDVTSGSQDTVALTASQHIKGSIAVKPLRQQESGPYRNVMIDTSLQPLQKRRRK